MTVTVSQLINLKGRRALITGAIGHIGKVLAETLAELGADLVLVDLPGSDLKGLSDSLSNRWGVTIHHKHCDLEQPVDREDLIHWLKKSGAGMNILINNAAFVGTSELQGWSVPFEEQRVETWRRALEVNLTAVFYLCQSLTPMLKIAEGATIVNIASMYGHFGPDYSLYEGISMNNPAAYGVSKGGLIQFTRWLSTTIAPDVRVNAISPGGVFRNQPEKFVQRYKSKTPLGRMATEDDFRGVIAYLASDLSAYVTGQNIAVDGGWGVW